MYGKISMVINKKNKNRVYIVEWEKKVREERRFKILNTKMVREKGNGTSRKK